MVMCTHVCQTVSRCFAALHWLRLFLRVPERIVFTARHQWDLRLGQLHDSSFLTVNFDLEYLEYSWFNTYSPILSVLWSHYLPFARCCAKLVFTIFKNFWEHQVLKSLVGVFWSLCCYQLAGEFYENVCCLLYFLHPPITVTDAIRVSNLVTS